jgi:hypothetical protein
MVAPRHADAPRGRQVLDRKQRARGRIQVGSGHLNQIPDGRGDDYYFGAIPGAAGRSSSVRIDDTILPGCTLQEGKIFGVQLRPAGLYEESVRSELTAMLVGLRLALQLATETSPGTIKEESFREVVDVEKTVESLKSAGVIKT